WIRRTPSRQVNGVTNVCAMRRSGRTLGAQGDTKRMDQTLNIERFALRAGPPITRYSIVFLLVLFGAMKWTAAEAHGIQPLVSHSPLWSWLYGVLGVEGTSIFFGVFEIAAAVAIAVRPWFPLASAA